MSGRNLRIRRGDEVSIGLSLVADLLALMNRLHLITRDPDERKRVLLDGLVGIVNARSGVCIVARDEKGKSPTVLTVTFHERGAAVTGLRRASRQPRRGRRRKAAQIYPHHDHPLVRRALAEFFEDVPHAAEGADGGLIHLNR